MAFSFNSTVGLNPDFLKKKVKIYDADKQELIKECESVGDAAKFTGLQTRAICGHLKHKTRSKPQTNTLGKRLAFR